MIGYSAVAFLLLILAAPALLPQATGSLAGHVRSGDGGPVSGGDGLIVRRDVSGIDGCYRLGLLPSGTYVVAARRLGFRAVSQSGIEVESGRAADVKIVLTDAPAALDPVVVGGAPNAIDAGRHEVRRSHRCSAAVGAAMSGATPRSLHFHPPSATCSVNRAH